MKVSRLEGMTRGWFVGNFVPTSLATDACEVACKRYLAGDKEERHLHRVATEVTLVMAGQVKMNGRDFGAGDVIVLEPGELADFEAIEEATTVVVKVPCAANDKYVVSEGDNVED